MLGPVLTTAARLQTVPAVSAGFGELLDLQ
jgi:hypothetical protein